MKTIFVVDDNDTNLLRAKQSLEGHYRVITMSSAARMFELLKKITPDLIMLDIEMPEMDGFEAITLLKADERAARIPVVFLTGRSDYETEVKVFSLGAVDFISKPFYTAVLLNRLKTHIHIDELIQERTAQIEQLHSNILSIVANMVENRDSVTGGHIERTSRYIEILMRAMKQKGVYTEELNSWDTKTVISSARLHDIGKITVKDSILNKPGSLTDEEYAEIKRHSTAGERIIDQMIGITGNESFLRHAKAFAGCHHEKFGGGGYPLGLIGEEIPLQGRIMAVVDVYDALVSKRPYKEPYSHEEAARIINNDIGTFFDPAVIDVFNSVKDEFAALG